MRQGYDRFFWVSPEKTFWQGLYYGWTENCPDLHSRMSGRHFESTPGQMRSTPGQRGLMTQSFFCVSLVSCRPESVRKYCSEDSFRLPPPWFFLASTQVSPVPFLFSSAARPASDSPPPVPHYSHTPSSSWSAASLPSWDLNSAHLPPLPSPEPLAALACSGTPALVGS